jgi:hypothetical protein
MAFVKRTHEGKTSVSLSAFPASMLLNRCRLNLMNGNGLLEIYGGREYNIKVNLKEFSCEVVDCIQMA